MVAMSSGEKRNGGPQFRTATMIISAAMVGGGCIIALAGLALGSGHMAVATRRWVNEMDVPVSQLAKVKIGQARAAMSAGAQAWQKNGSGTAPVPAGY
jgi:hypothetical protein